MNFEFDEKFEDSEASDSNDFRVAFCRKEIQKTRDFVWATCQAKYITTKKW